MNDLLLLCSNYVCDGLEKIILLSLAVPLRVLRKRKYCKTRERVIFTDVKLAYQDLQER